MEQVRRNGLMVATTEGLLIVIEEGLEGREERREVRVWGEEDRDGPVSGKVVGLSILDCAAPEHGEQRLDGNERFIVAQACAKACDALRDDLGELASVWSEAGDCGLEEVQPGVLDVLRVVVVGDLIDEEADVVVPGLVRIGVVQL